MLPSVDGDLLIDVAAGRAEGDDIEGCGHFPATFGHLTHGRISGTQSKTGSKSIEIIGAPKGNRTTIAAVKARSWALPRVGKGGLGYPC